MFSLVVAITVYEGATRGKTIDLWGPNGIALAAIAAPVGWVFALGLPYKWIDQQKTKDPGLMTFRRDMGLAVTWWIRAVVVSSIIGFRAGWQEAAWAGLVLVATVVIEVRMRATGWGFPRKQAE